MVWKDENKRVRKPKIEKKHNKAMLYFKLWWKKRTGRELNDGKTYQTLNGEYTPDLENDTEIIQFERRTSHKNNKRPWITGRFRFPTLDDFKHKVEPHLGIAKATNRKAYVVQCCEDMTYLVIADYESFERTQSFMRPFPGGVTRECYSTNNFKCLPFIEKYGHYNPQEDWFK